MTSCFKTDNSDTFFNDGPDLSLSLRYSLFHERSASLLSAFYLKIDKYGSLNISSYDLNLFQRRMNTLISEFSDLPGAVSDKLLRISILEEQLGPENRSFGLLKDGFIFDMRRKANEKNEYISYVGRLLSNLESLIM